MADGRRPSPRVFTDCQAAPDAALDSRGALAAQIRAIRGLEQSLAEGRPRALIQMASGGGKTFTACNFVYRLIKYANARRVRGAGGDNPALRNKLIEVKKSFEQTIDTVSQDQVIEAGFSLESREKAQAMVRSFEEFIRENKDEITALQILYSRPYRQRLTLKQIKELADAIQKPPRAWTPEVLWRAYEALDKSKVRPSGGRMLTDIVSLVRFALHQEGELRPFREHVQERFTHWLAEQERNWRRFTDEQRQWLELIRDHVAASLTMEMEDFELTPFAQRGGPGKAYQLFGKQLSPLLDELSEVLTA